MRSSIYIKLCFIFLISASSAAMADVVEYVVVGVEDPMNTNVVNHVSSFRIGASAKLNSRLRRKLLEDTRVAASKAMRPYGYFNPEIDVGIQAVDTGKWRVNINIKAGPPVRVQQLSLDLTGPGSELEDLRTWEAEFPLTVGKRLNQPVWDKTKLDAIELLESSGYLNAAFTRHAIRVDTQTNTATLELSLDTGSQAVIGNVSFKQDFLNDGVLASLQRFKPGDPYSAWLLDKFRLDLWRSGYFEDIRLIERRELTSSPPRVDLEVEFEARKRNTFQSTVGFGTDTLVRAQFMWGRHLLSRRGDSFDIGFGWKQRDNEFTFQSNYRLPRRTESRQYWTGSFGIKSENQSITVSPGNDPEDSFALARGKYNDYSLKLGKIRARNLKGGFQQLFETVFVQYLREESDFSLVEYTDPYRSNLVIPVSSDDLFVRSGNSLIAGILWDWPEIRGTGFQTTGHHEQAWVFTSNEIWGSDADFSQLYLSSRVNLLAGDRWKFLFRAEVGYSDAKTDDFDIGSTMGPLSLSVTELPYFYRFKAGGSRSVRGYAFESLDNNGLGSNHFISASAEVEYLFYKDWSVAAFADFGNAFNDWKKPELKFGSGFGLRWYSVIGALRLDLAQGWDVAGEPWRIHLTIGTPLL